MGLSLSTYERDMLEGREGEAAALAMRVLIGLAESAGSSSLIEVTRSHVAADFPGESMLDWLRTLTHLGAKFKIPTTLNIASFDLLHPELNNGGARMSRAAKEVMLLAAGMGGAKTWTCAPYLLTNPPSFGEHIAWSESGAVLFANSVLGARTERSGTFTDVCAALTGRMPKSGLHLDENRVPQMRFRLLGFRPNQLIEEITYHLLGYWIGAQAGSLIPWLEGVPTTATDEQLQVLGTALATTGSMGMFHVEAVTPEALGDSRDRYALPEEITDVRPEDLRTTAKHLSGGLDQLPTGRPIDAVCLGTPHYSLAQFEELVALVREWGADKPAAVKFYVNTNRHVLRAIAARGWESYLRGAGVTLVTDTCTYMSPVLEQSTRVVMTNSVKWAQYGVAQADIDVMVGSTLECVRSAQIGAVWRDEDSWS